MYVSKSDPSLKELHNNLCFLAQRKDAKVANPKKNKWSYENASARYEAKVKKKEEQKHIEGEYRNDGQLQVQEYFRQQREEYNQTTKRERRKIWNN